MRFISGILLGFTVVVLAGAAPVGDGAADPVVCDDCMTREWDNGYVDHLFGGPDSLILHVCNGGNCHTVGVSGTCDSVHDGYVIFPGGGGEEFLGMAPIDMLVLTLEAANAGRIAEIERLAAKYEYVSVNRTRNAVQIFDCSGAKVVAQAVIQRG